MSAAVTATYTADEMMAVAASRRLTDDSVCFVGIGLPSLAANLEVDDIDLQLLTQAFSFGRISGRMDGYMRDLRMLDWKPVAFDAWFGTPADQDRSNAISRQAVNHLTSIGGGGPTAVAKTRLIVRPRGSRAGAS